MSTDKVASNPRNHLIVPSSILAIQGIPAFRDFTIRDPRYFVILFEAKFHDFEEKNPKKIFFSENFFFRNFFWKF